MSENPFAQFVKPQEKKEENPFAQFVQKSPDKNSEQGNFSRGFETAMRQVPQTIGGVIGLAGDAVGSDSVKDYGMNIYNKQSQKIQDISKDSDSFSNVLEADASLGDWAGYGVGYVGGQALQALATGGAGAFIGKKIAQAGLNKAVKEGVEHEISDEAKKQALSKAAQRGAGVGMFGGNAVQEVGSIYPEALHQAEEDGRTLDGGDLARVTGAGLAAAGVDTLTDMSLLKGVLGGGSSASNILKRAAKTIPTGMAKEGATEGIQTGIERWGAQQDLVNDEAVRDYVDSAALGALGGGLAGAGGAIQQRGKREADQQQAQATQEEQRFAAESHAQEQQQLAEQQQKLFGFGANPDASLNADDVYAKTGIPPSPVIDESKLLPNALSYENGIDYQPPQINSGLTSGNEVPPNADVIPYTPQQMHDTWSLAGDAPQDYGNSIEFGAPESKSRNLESQIQFNDTYGQDMPDPVIDYGALSPFNDAQQPIIDQTKLSERLGINPNDGPMSSAAALAVDSGASPVVQNAPPVTTADAIKHGMSEISRGMDEGARNQVAEYLRNGNTDRLTYRKEDAINAALANPNYNVQRNDDGSVTVVGVKTADGNWHGVSNESTTAQQSQAPTTSVPTQQFSLNTEAQEPTTATKPNFSSHHPAGTVTHAQDIADQALQQYSGDTSALANKSNGLFKHTPATELIYSKNSPSYSDVEVVDAGDKAIVKLTNSRTGAVEERVYPHELVRFNNFLNGNQQQVENLSNISNKNNIDTISAQTEEVEAAPLSSQIAQLEQQLSETKPVPQRNSIKKQINELKSQLENQGRASWEGMSLEQRQAVVEQIETNMPLGMRNRLPTAEWDRIGPAVKAKLIGAMGQSIQPLTNRPVSQPQIEDGSPQVSTNHPFQQYDTVAQQYGRSVSPNGVILSSDGKDTGVRIVEKKGRVHVESSNGQLLHTGADANSIGNFLEKFWGDKKSNNPSSQIDTNAYEAATSPLNDTLAPTQAQIEAGNYKKGHIKVHGLDISIENPKGSERRGTDPNGKEWAHTMSDHYGYIKRTKGADNEHIDTYIGNNPDSNQVFIVDQLDQETGNFDEHKVMLGFDSQEDATTAYQSNFDKGWKVGPIRTMNMEQFKDWLKNEDTSKPATNTDANKPKEAIKDLGEKIGGARKDTALSTGKSKKTKSTDNRPTWAKRYTISEIVSSTNSNETGKWVIEDSKKTDWKGSPKKLGMFDSEQEAKDMLPVVAVGLKHRVYARRDGGSGFEIWRQINDVKRVKVVNKVFDTKQDAQTYLIENANNILETSTTFGELDLPRPENTVRKGIERRKGDAKDTDFMKVFGFRGVEFGNWNNQEERQQLLNDAYDGLLDLAEVLKIPAKAISLNGDLALAFGARGQGLSSARAHYEPAKVVINLTKMNGAGSLAHEWWHAFDHYLARQDGIASAEWVVDADGTRSLKITNNSKDRMVSHGFSYRNSGVREDVRNAYTDLMKTMSTKAEQYVEDVQAVDKFVGQSRDRVKERLDSLREDLSQQRDPKYYKRHNKPASAEQLVVFDTISQKLINGELLETEWRTDVKNKSASGIFSGARWTNDALEQLGEIYKSVRGRSGFSKDQDAVLDRLRSAMNSYANRLKMLADAQKEVSKTRKIPTKFVMDAKNLDEGRGSDYWTTPHELSARAFQGFVEDKIAENNGRSPFLNHAPENAAIETPWGWVRPYPHGDERKAINAKFSDLVDTLKTEETETGVKLYSRDKLKPDNERRGASPLDTTFTPLSVVSATRRVLSILEHLKIVTTQIDASVRGRIIVGWQRVGVNKVKGLDSHSFTVQVVESFDGLPSAIQEDNRYQGENGETKRYDVLGVWHNGTLYINAGDIQGNNSTQQTTFEMYEELILHEVVGHFGVQQIFGREYKTKLQQLFNALGGLEGIRKIAKDNGVDMQQFNDVYINPRMQAVKDEIYTESDVQQSLVGELFAFVAQNAKSRPFVRQKLKEVLGYIRQWFRDRGFDKFLSRYNDADLMMFLSEARKAVVDRSYFGKYKNQEFSSKNDSDTPLYSRKSDNQKTGKTIAQVREALIKRFGKATIEALEKQGKLEIIQDYQVEGVEGYYRNGKAVLVASNLNDDSIIPTFLHELGGHAGFQNMMSQKQYNELMNQFNKLVEQGNPIALEAKKLAEREQGSERQQLEYLPYLLTLASNMQIKNAVHKGNVKRLISDLISKVKAWIYDRLGVNINLNPNDMVALAERMIDKAANNSNSERPNNSAQYSLNEKSHAPFQKAIDDVVAGSTPLGYVRMGKTPDVLKMLGLPDVPVTINGATIEKVMAQHLGLAKGEHSNIHNLTPDTLRQLPKQLNNPVAVFKSGTDATKQGYVVLTELTEKDIKTGMDKPVIAALHVKTTNKGLELINIGSVYGKDSLKSIQNSLDKDLLYWHKEKGQNFVNAFRLQLPSHMQIQKTNLSSKGSQSNVGSLQLQPETHSNVSLSKANIKTNEDLVKYQSNQPLFSRKSFDDVINNLSQNLKSLTFKSVKDKAGDKKIDWLGIGLSALGRRQLTEIYAKLLPQLNKYNELAAQMDADKNDAGAEADTIVREWGNLNDEEALANVMHDSTLAKIDPTKPYVSGDSISKYNQLRDAYNSLSPEAQAMYVKARDAYKQHYAEVHQAIKERILRSELSNQKKADLLKQMDDNFFGSIKGVYFPLARFGKYVVVMRNQNGEVESVSRAETMGEARALRSELMQKYPHYKVDRVTLDKEFNTSRDAVGRGFMSSLFAEVDNLGLSAAEQAEFEDTLSQLYLSSMPDLSWAKHGIHRKGTAGFSQDARRAFAQNMFGGANYLAKLRYGDQLAQQLDNMQKYASEQSKLNNSYDQPTAQRVIDEMNKRHDLLMNPKSHPLSSALTSLGFIYYLGLSPASAMVNLMQTPLVAYPVLGSKWGYDKAGKALIKASEQAIKGKNDISKSLSVDEKKAYDHAVNSGVIDVTQAHDLAGIAQGEDSGIMWKTRPVMRWASFLFHQAERFNREVTFIAAYRLSRENGATHDQAYEQATDATYRGHFDYSSGNRPRLMQGNVAKVMLLFKQFGQNMVYLLARQAHQAIKAESPQDRAQARRLLTGVLTTHALAAGVLGLPMVTTLLAAASMIGGDDDEPWDAEVALRNFLADIFGSNISNMIMKGASRGMPWDISGRVGLNNLILPDIQEGLEGQRLSESAMAAALGPVASIGTNVLKGAQEISEGQFERGIETMLPTFLRSPLKALRFADEGVQDKTGISIQDEVATLGLIGQAMGFSPSDVRTNMEGKSAIYQLNRKLDTRRAQLMAQWSRAKLIDDTDRMDEVWEEIQRFNEKNPSRRINRINLNQSYKNRKNRIDKAENGIYLSRNRQDAREAGRFAFGE